MKMPAIKMVAHKPGNLGIHRFLRKHRFHRNLLSFFSGFEDWALRKIPFNNPVVFSQRNMKL